MATLYLEPEDYRSIYDSVRPAMARAQNAVTGVPQDQLKTTVVQAHYAPQYVLPTTGVGAQIAEEHTRSILRLYVDPFNRSFSKKQIADACQRMIDTHGFKPHNVEMFTPDQYQAIHCALRAFEPGCLARFPEATRRSIESCNIFITVVYDNAGLIPGQAVAAAAARDGSGMLIRANPNHADFSLTHIVSSYPHEMHHIGRMYSAAGYGAALGECATSEGLAIGCEVENGFGVPSYALQLEGRNLRKVAQLIARGFDDKNFNRGKWYFASRKKKLINTIYTAGFGMTNAYCRANGVTPSEAVGIDSKLVRDWWRANDLALDFQPIAPLSATRPKPVQQGVMFEVAAKQAPLPV